jgi:hypothetical protein
VPNFSKEMEEFFNKLGSMLKNPEKKERQMKEVREVFDREDIDYDQLIKTGNLVISDDR